MENFVTGLALSAITGATYIAYRHPVLYEREFAPKILYSALGILFIVLIYDAGYDAAVVDLFPHLIDSDAPEISAFTEDSGIDDSVGLVSLGVAIYSGFLSWLADHMKNETEGRHDS